MNYIWRHKLPYMDIYERRLLKLLHKKQKKGNTEFNSVYRDYKGPNMKLYNQLHKLETKGFVELDPNYSYLRTDSIALDRILLQGSITADGANYYKDKYQYMSPKLTFTISIIALSVSMVSMLISLGALLFLIFRKP